MKGKSRNIEIAVMAIIIIAVIIVIMAILKMSVSNYSGELYATVRVTGERHGDTDEAFEQEYDIHKGEGITLGQTVLEITDITRNGDISFKVKQGTLYDCDNNPLTSDTIDKETTGRYTTDDASFKMTVIDCGRE